MSQTIRPATVEDAAGITQVHIVSWQTTYRGIIPNDFLANLSYERRKQAWERLLGKPVPHYHAYVAVDQIDQIVGFVDGGPARGEDAGYQGELYAIYLLEEYQGRGLGRRLVKHLVEGLVHNGITSMSVAVLAENPACRFYEALGAQFVRSLQIEIGDAQLEEKIYGWHNIHSLL